MWNNRRSNNSDPFFFVPNFDSRAWAPNPNPPANSSPGDFTNVDWRETPDSHIFELDLPGMKKDEVKVELHERGILQISGDRKIKEQEAESDRWVRVERRSGKFFRRFHLSDPVMADQVKAHMEDGVLTVIITKEKEKKPDVKVIKIS